MSSNRPKRYKQWLDADEGGDLPDRSNRRKQSKADQEGVPPVRIAGRQRAEGGAGDEDDPCQGGDNDVHQIECERAIPPGQQEDHEREGNGSQIRGTNSDPDYQLNQNQTDPSNLPAHSAILDSGDEQDDEDVGDERPYSPMDNAFYLHQSEFSDAEDDIDTTNEEQSASRSLNLPLNKLHEKLEGDLKNIISESVRVSPSEVLLNCLELAKQHNLPHDAHANMLKLINCMFDSNVVPDTRYLLDELYVSSSGMNYHFYCQVCKDVIPNVGIKTSGSVNCMNEDCGHVNSMKDLREKNCYFVTFDIPTQLKILFDCDSVIDALKSPAELVRENTNVMKDLYGGRMYIAFAQSLDHSKPVKYISFTMCFDGTPLFKSSGCEVWPLFLIVNELPPHIRMQKLILAGFWFGEKKPNCPCFFEVLVANLKDLSNIGCDLEVKGQSILFNCYMIACCVDSGARGAIQEVHQHNGQCGCSWCLHPGERVGGSNNARMYCKLDEKPPLRTKEEMIEDGRRVIDEGLKHMNGVTGVSFLASLPKFDIVQGMVVDCLHAKFLGVARQFAKLWFGTDGIDKWINAQNLKAVNPPYYIGSPSNVKKINRLIGLVTPTVETRRMPRAIEDLKYFKSRDWENFVLYTSVLLLKNILPDAYLNHWILFVQGCYLLMRQDLTHEDIDLAEELFDRFTSQIEILYKNGDAEVSPNTPCKQMKYNVHLLDHAADNARRWGPDWCISAYAFEAGNFDIKKMIKSNKGIPNQIIRQVSQDMARNLMKCSSANTPAAQDFASSLSKRNVSKFVRVGDCVLLGSIGPLVASIEEECILRQANLNPREFIQCSKVVSNHCVYTIEHYEKSSRRNNSVVQLSDNSFVVIRKIIACENTSQVYVFTSVIRTTPYHSPGITRVPSSKRFLHTVILCQEEKQLHSFNEIKIVCVRSNVGPLGHTLSPMPNIFTIC